MNKKRYAALLWTNPDKYDKMDCKGIETVRRDNCQLVKEVVDTSLRAILIHKNPEIAIAYVKNQISQLLMNEMDMSKLVITKALTKTGDQYAAGNKQAHVELAARIKKRDPGLAPAVGDRVPYVMIKGPVGAKAWEKAEDPIYVLDNNLPARHRLVPRAPAVGADQAPLRADRARTRTRCSRATTRARSRRRCRPTAGLMKFVAVTQRCLGCKASLPGGKDEAGSALALCASCEPKEAEVY